MPTERDLTQRYLVIHRSVPAPHDPPSPAQMQQMYAAFAAWKEKFQASIVDLGGRLASGGRVVTEAGVKDGPFVESKEIVGGYMVIAAESYDQALEISRGCPGVLVPGASLEIRELVSA